jgi:hypothetical protein
MPKPATDAVRRAAETLLDAAPISAVIAAMRALLAGMEPECRPADAQKPLHTGRGSAVTLKPSAAPTGSTATPQANGASVAKTPATPAPQADADEAAAWEALRQRVRKTPRPLGGRPGRAARRGGLQLRAPSSRPAASLCVTRRPPTERSGINHRIAHLSCRVRCPLSTHSRPSELSRRTPGVGQNRYGKSGRAGHWSAPPWHSDERSRTATGAME